MKELSRPVTAQQIGWAKHQRPQQETTLMEMLTHTVIEAIERGWLPDRMTRA